MSDTVELPIFPLGSVLFPGGRLALRIFEPRYVAMTRAAMRDNRPFGVALIRAGYEVGKPAIPCDVGCTARIVECSDVDAETFALAAQGEAVFRIVSRETRPDGLIVAQVELQEPPDPTPLPGHREPMAWLLQKLLGEIGDRHAPSPQRMQDAAWVGNRLAELLPVPPERKQALLELGAQPLAVLDRIAAILQQLREEG
jgi:Lon protease-like protein